MEVIHLREDYIKLGQALKAAGLVRVNDRIEVQRGKKLVAGDMVEYRGKNVKIEV